MRNVPIIDVLIMSGDSIYWFFSNQVSRVSVEQIFSWFCKINAFWGTNLSGALDRALNFNSNLSQKVFDVTKFILGSEARGWGPNRFLFL